jgi:hypothetical protein
LMVEVPFVEEGSGGRTARSWVQCYLNGSGEALWSSAWLVCELRCPTSNPKEVSMDRYSIYIL